MKLQLMPVAMGGLMGPMLLWMLHGTLTSDGPSGVALAVFVGAHVLIVILLLAATIFAARLSSALRLRMERLHRPSLRHFSTMLASAVVAAGGLYLFVQGIG